MRNNTLEEGRPLVSIIVRTKDRPKLLKKALASISAQTYRPVEVVLVNDGGCELDTEELKELLNDMPLNYIRLEKNAGRAHAGNVGLKNAKGEYVGFLDDDDEFYPEHVETLVTFLEHSEYKVAYTDSFCVFQEWVTDKYVTVSKKVLYSQDFDREGLLVANYIPMLNVLFRKDLIFSTGLLDEKLEAHEDWDMWLRLSQHSDFYHINKITAEFSMRTDGTTITSSNRKAFLETARIIHKRYSPSPPDEKIVKGQNTVEWLLAKGVVTNGEKLENSYLVDIAEALIQQKDIQIGNLEAAIQRDIQIRQKDTQIGNLEAAINGKDIQIREKDARIEDLEAAINGKDARIEDLQAAINGKEARIEDLQGATSEKDDALNNIYSSHGWKTLLFYYKVRDRIFPPSSRRRKAAKLAWNLLSPAGSGWKGRRRSIVDASEGRFARSLVSAYSSSTFLRSSFAAANVWSHKYVRPWFPALHDKFFVDFKLYLKKRWLTGGGGNGAVLQPQLYSLPKPADEEFLPKVSVIIPNYNHARYLRQRLEAVYRQTYKNIEVVLLDDNSDDESTQILEEYRLRYPNITKCIFNDKNSGSVFYQWQRGIESAQGELIWIAESDDYCSDNLIEELVHFFANEAVMLAFCKTVFVDGDTDRQSWSLEEYLADVIDPALWQQPFIKSANYLVNTMWGIRNIVANVGSAVFRNPGKLELLENEPWKRMRICGDWIFYLHIIRGGLVAYTPKATNFFRMHEKNTSVNTYNQDIYYREHEKVAEELVKLYRLQEGVLEKQRRVLEGHWRLHRADYSEHAFMRCYNSERIKHLSKSRKPNLLIIAFALASGGGETFAVRLSNLLKSNGSGVTLLNFHREPTQQGVRRMLHKSIPLLELDRWDKLSMVVDDMGIEIVHSHHAWVDVTICSLLEDNPNCKVIVTTHGMYEMMSRAEINRVNRLLKERVDRFVYLADKNLDGFDFNIVEQKHFVKIGNAMEKVPITPVPREDLGIRKEDFVLCMVSRAIPEKGWKEGIAAVALARELSGKEIHLLLIGDGPEYERLKNREKTHFIHFMGFKDNVCDYFATSDLGFLPSRFRGESYPLVIIECLQANRPVLASDIGETAKMLETESGPAGSVFALDNWKIPVKRIAELIAGYATNKAWYSEQLARVPEAVKKFDPEKMVQRYEKVYREVLEEDGKDKIEHPAEVGKKT